MTDFPEPSASRPLWLMTLADLALLLVGFLVLVQATSLDRDALAKVLREGFGVTDAPMPVPPPVTIATSPCIPALMQQRSGARSRGGASR